MTTMTTMMMMKNLLLNEHVHLFHPPHHQSLKGSSSFLPPSIPTPHTPAQKMLLLNDYRRWVLINCESIFPFTCTIQFYSRLFNFIPTGCWIFTIRHLRWRELRACQQWRQTTFPLHLLSFRTTATITTRPVTCQVWGPNAWVHGAYGPSVFPVS